MTIHEGSPVHSVRSEGSRAVARTERGCVRATAAVLATGPALAGHRALRRRLTVTSSHMVITEPVPDVIAALGWTGGECITDSRAMLHYFRTTPDGRIAFGWGGGRVVPGARLNGRAELDRSLVAELERHLVRFFPRSPDAESSMRGVGRSTSRRRTSRCSAASTAAGSTTRFGYTGNGVGPSRVAGRALASMALQRRDEAAQLPIVDSPAVRVPPEPLRYAGGTMVRAALLRRERLEEEGRRPGALTRAISGLPARIGIHIGR